MMTVATILIERAQIKKLLYFRLLLQKKRRVDQRILTPDQVLRTHPVSDRA